MFMRLLLLLAILSLNALPAQSKETDMAHRPSVLYPKNWLHHWEWTREQWTGNDEPYRRVRQEIDSAIKKGENPDAVLLRYQEQALKRLSNTKAVFGWGYAAYRANALAHDGKSRIGYSLDALAQPPSPHSYEYDRLRFWMESQDAAWYQLNGLGQRLLKREPNSYTIRYYVILNLTDSRDYVDRPLSRVIADMQKAIPLAQTLVAAHPKEPSAYSLLAQASYSLWRLTNNQSDGDRATSAWQQYLKMVPANDPGRSFILFSLEVIRGGQIKNQFGRWVPRRLLPH